MTTTTYKDRPLPVFRNLQNYTLFAPAVEQGGKQPRLLLSYMDGRPRFTVYTNVSTDENRGIISAGYYPDTFFSILDSFEAILDAAPGTSQPIRNLKPVKTDEGKLTGEKVVDTQVTFGKDDTGIIYIQLAAQGRTKIKFQFKLNEYNQIFKTDKTPLTEEEGSVFVARGWLNGIRRASEINCSALMPEQADKTGYKAGSVKPVAATSSSSMLDLDDDDIPL